MSEKDHPSALAAQSATQPFFYEIRVKGRLSQEKWTSWFDDLTIASEKGETVLRGSLPDHAGLYGLIGRLRDLAVPLLAVNVLDAEALRQLRRRNRRYNLWINLLLVVVYLLLMGGLITLTVFITSVIHTALALALLFAMLGGLSYIFYLWKGHRLWRYLTYLLWPVSILVFFIYLSVADLVHPALTIATLLFLAAGGVIYLVYYLQGRAEETGDDLADWEALAPQAETAAEVDEVETLKKEESPEG